MAPVVVGTPLKNPLTYCFIQSNLITLLHKHNIEMEPCAEPVLFVFLVQVSCSTAKNHKRITATHNQVLLCVFVCAHLSFIPQNKRDSMCCCVGQTCTFGQWTVTGLFV